MLAVGFFRGRYHAWDLLYRVGALSRCSLGGEVEEFAVGVAGPRILRGMLSGTIGTTP